MDTSHVSDMPANAKVRDPHVAPLLREEDFAAHTLADRATFWDERGLQGHPGRERFPGFVLGGISLPDFVDPAAQGVFHGRNCAGVDLMPAEFPNHVPTKFETFLSTPKQQCCYRKHILYGERISLSQSRRYHWGSRWNRENPGCSERGGI